MTRTIPPGRSSAVSGYATAGPPAADPLKWTARYNGALFEASSLVQTNYDMIEVGMMVIGAEAGANVVNYSNAPSDIQDALGRQLAALTGLPLA